jgi:hypothetical protein
MPEVIENERSTEIRSRMPTGQRVLFLAFALFPLIAPYQLIIRPGWTDYTSPFFLFALFISVGAVAVSLMLAWAAFAGLSSRIKFDRERGTVTYQTCAPIVPLRTVRRSIGSIAAVRTATHDWTEGSPSYSFVTEMEDGSSFKCGSSWSREEIDRIVVQVSAFLGLPIQG